MAALCKELIVMHCVQGYAVSCLHIRDLAEIQQALYSKYQKSTEECLNSTIGISIWMSLSSFLFDHPLPD